MIMLFLVGSESQTQSRGPYEATVKFELVYSGSAYDYFRSHKRDFYGQGDGVESLLAKYLSSRKVLGHKTLLFIDIGAAPFDGQCFVTYAVDLFGCDKERTMYYAFEPANMPLLAAHIFSNTTWKQSVCISLVEAGASSTSGSAEMLANEKNTASLEHASLGRQGNLRNVTTVALDDFLGHVKHNFVNFLKIDTEGHDFYVLQGARKLIRERRVHVVIIEYSDKMNAAFWTASYGNRSVTKPRDIQGPTLKKVVMQMRTFGYSAYLIGVNGGLLLTESVWDERFEFCSDPYNLGFGTGVCWADVAFINELYVEVQPVSTNLSDI